MPRFGALLRIGHVIAWTNGCLCAQYGAGPGFCARQHHAVLSEGRSASWGIIDLKASRAPDGVRQVRRDGGFEFFLIGEFKLPRVQLLALHTEATVSVPVHLVPHHRASDEFHMDANLMCPARDRKRLHKCVLAETLSDPEFGDRRAAAFLDREPFPHPAIPRDRCLHPSFVARRRGVDQCQVSFIDFSGFELLLQQRQRCLVLGKNN